ncbi:MAG TPA: LamG domain-containing protein, partial [Candidatus Hydrogenedentes bacterium]|nr:LamG domain-containing protein [Candidatus Hydrogenedentota bacterium]
GTEYAAWLPAAKPLPVPVALSLPEDGAEGAPGALLFRWETYAHPDITYRLCIARDADFADIIVQRMGLTNPFVIVDDSLNDAGEYFWKVIAENAHGSADNAGGVRRFRVNPAAPQAFSAGVREDGAMIDAPMHGDAAPVFGVLDEVRNVTFAENRAGTANAALRFADGMARYRLPFFPESDYTAAAWIRPEGLTAPGLQQVFSAWHRASDDPLRITIEGGAVHARIESPAGFASTAGVPLREGEWTHVAAVKQSGQLTLYVNGAAGAPAAVPEKLSSSSLEAAFGANPRYPGGEYFRGCISNAVFFARALSETEVQHFAN